MVKWVETEAEWLSCVHRSSAGDSTGCKELNTNKLKYIYLLFFNSIHISYSLQRSRSLQRRARRLHVSLARKRHDLLLQGKKTDEELLENCNLWVTLAKITIHKSADLRKRAVKVARSQRLIWKKSHVYRGASTVKCLYNQFWPCCSESLSRE